MERSDYETVKSLVRTLKEFGVVTRRHEKQMLEHAHRKYEARKFKQLVNSIDGASNEKS